MDIPLVLEKMGLTPQDWGPTAQTGKTYEEFYLGWRGAVPVPSKEDMLAAWALVQLDNSPEKIAERERAIAKGIIASERTPNAKVARALVSILVDEINLLRGWITDFKAATAAATSLANLQSRVAGLSNMPARTMVQAKQAIDNAIDSGSVD